MEDLTIIGTAIWSRDMAQEVDRLSSEKYGINSLVLMETAGRAVYELAESQEAGERPVSWATKVRILMMTILKMLMPSSMIHLLIMIRTIRTPRQGLILTVI